MKAFFQVLLICLSALFTCVSSQGHAAVDDDPCQIDRKVERRVFAEYEVSATVAGEFMNRCGELEIKRSGKTVFHESIAGEFILGPSFDKHSHPFLFLTGRKMPNLVISELEDGGAHCCNTLHIFELDGGLKRIGHIKGYSSVPMLKDLDHDGIPEILFDDYAFNYRFGSFGGSAKGPVIMKYTKQGYVLAPDMMKKPAPPLFAYDSELRHWSREFHEEKFDFPPSSLVQTVTNLVYSGNAKAAWALIDRAWPADVEGKEEFISEYNDALNTSEYYPKFRSGF